MQVTISLPPLNTELLIQAALEFLLNSTRNFGQSQWLILRSLLIAHESVQDLLVLLNFAFVIALVHCEMLISVLPRNYVGHYRDACAFASSFNLRR